MKFITQKSEIVDALQISAAVAERRQTIPILANLRIIAKNNKIEIDNTVDPGIFKSDFEKNLFKKNERRGCQIYKL